MATAPPPPVYNPQSVAKYRDYSLDGPESEAARKKGLASAQWYVPHIERKTLRRLMQRDDYHALRDTALWIIILASSGLASCRLWSQERYGAFVLTFLVYCTFYTSAADSRWHECGHATAFKTKWMNDVVYECASFMVFREALLWRFSHARHHTDTDIVGRDPEIDGRPLTLYNLCLAFFNYQGICATSKSLWVHAGGNLLAGEKTYVPKSEHAAVCLQARVWLAIYALTIAASFAAASPLPAMFIFLPYSLGAWHFVLVGVFQHATLAHDVLDHRLNTRTCYINPISAFIYWNMHYHVEHHIFPMVPYYNLPALHRELASQLPKPYGSIWEVYCEMIPALLKQARDPEYYTDRRGAFPRCSSINHRPRTTALLLLCADLHPLWYRPSPKIIYRRGALPPPLPAASTPSGRIASLTPDDNGWVAACTVDEVPAGAVIRFDVGPRTYCVYHAEDDGKFYATAGKCTHGAALLADGLVTGSHASTPATTFLSVHVVTYLHGTWCPTLCSI